MIEAVNLSELDVHRDRAEEKVYVVSFPKSGRTWLRVLISRYKQLLLGLDTFQLALYAAYAPGYSPQFVFSHAGSADVPPGPFSPRRLVRFLRMPRAVAPDHFSFDPFTGSRVIFLLRDPRAVSVSYYHELSRRRRYFRGGLGDFIRDPDIGLPKVLRFMAFLARERHRFDHQVVWYEDLHRGPRSVLRGLLEFSSTPVLDDYLARSIEFGAFANMQELERSGVYGERLRPKDAADPNSYKVRTGRIDSFRHELAATDLSYADRLIERELDEFYARYRPAQLLAEEPDERSR